MRTTPPQFDRVVASDLFLLLAAFYVLTRTQAHYYADDSIRWALEVERGNLHHQHHLAYLYVPSAFRSF
jgi:hypothetical protein